MCCIHPSCIWFIHRLWLCYFRVSLSSTTRRPSPINSHSHSHSCLWALLSLSSPWPTNQTKQNNKKKMQTAAGARNRIQALVLRGSSTNTELLCRATAREFITDTCQHIGITHVEHSFNLTGEFCAEREKTNTHFHLKSYKNGIPPLNEKEWNWTEGFDVKCVNASQEGRTMFNIYIMYEYICAHARVHTCIILNEHTNSLQRVCACSAVDERCSDCYQIESKDC